MSNKTKAKRPPCSQHGPEFTQYTSSSGKQYCRKISQSSKKLDDVHKDIKSIMLLLEKKCSLQTTMVSPVKQTLPLRTSKPPPPPPPPPPRQTNISKKYKITKTNRISPKKNAPKSYMNELRQAIEKRKKRKNYSAPKRLTPQKRPKRNNSNSNPILKQLLKTVQKQN